PSLQAKPSNPIGRIILELFVDTVPKTAENLCKFREGGKWKFMIQGGDFSNQNGTGGKSIYGEKFEDENFYYKHDWEGLLSMANAGRDTNGSQFFITTVPSPHLDGKLVVLRQVIKGIGVARILENVEVKSEKPAMMCVIAECGGLKEGADWGIFLKDGSDDSHPDFPEDADIDLKDNWEMAIRKYTKVLRYVDGSKAVIEKADRSKLQPTALSWVLNIGACKLKMSNWQGTVDSCLEAREIDPSNIKTLYCRAQGRQGFKKYDQLANLKKAQEIAPEDKKIKAQKDKEKAVYAKMFA
uniref:Peptidyl-prolyl cis-trans isomerase n=1 Tax=Microcebus murinus TaxID=30608 RepID=A0A8C6EKB3_MICMU